MHTKLSVNLNAIAYIRNRRDLPWPNLIEIGRQAMQAGAHGITVHPRPDQRHIKFDDLTPLRAMLDDEFPNAEFNIEGYPNKQFLKHAIETQPNQITLVPDEPEQSTSYFGWDYNTQTEFLKPIVAKLQKQTIRVSLFTDTTANLEKAKTTNAQRIEIYTGPYGACFDNTQKANAELEKLTHFASQAQKLGFEINAGHDLTLANLPALCRALPNLCEVSIGHALTADMFLYGVKKAVQLYCEKIA